MREMIAEAWSEYINNPTHRPIAKEVGQIKRISEYSADNAQEFFVECFAAREHGETLPDYMIDMLEIVTTMPREKGDTP